MALVSRFGGNRLPYALTVLLSTLMPSIYVDVQVVLPSPVARSAAPFIEPKGLPLMASALGTGIFCGYVFVIPGLAAISIAGLLSIKLGTWLLFGLVIGPVTAILTTLLMRQVLHRFDTVDSANAYLDSELFTVDVVTSLAPLLDADPEIRIYHVA